MSSSFMTMAALQLQLAVFVIAGYILTKTGTITPAGKKSLSDLMINFILPCNAICSFQMDMSASILASCGAILLVAAGTQFAYLLISKVIYPNAPRSRLACLRYATLCSNATFLGIPVINCIYGPMGTLLGAVALIPQRLVMWSAGISLFTKTDGKSVIKKLITHPCIIAVFIGFALMLAGNPPLPGFVQKALNSANGCLTCLSMVLIGSILAGAEHINLRDGMMWWFTFVRLILIPLIVFAALTAIPVDPLVRGTMVIISAMPAGTTTAILAAKYDGDAPFASCLIFISTLLSLLTLPFLTLIL